jgi:hypothetical protein
LQAVQQLLHILSVQRIIRRLAHALVGKRALYEIELIGPVVRVDIGHDLHARSLQPVDRVR